MPSKNKPALVLLHGFCENNSLWDHIIPNLNYGGNIIAPNLPGFGNTPLKLSKFAIADIAILLHNGLVNQGVTSCICIGHSLGGYVALALKAIQPKFVVSLGLINSTAFADSDDKKETRNILINWLNKNSADSFLSTFAPSLFNDKNKEALKLEMKKVIEMSVEVDSKTIQSYSAAMRDREDLTNLLVTESKFLFIGGACDVSIPKEFSIKQMDMLEDKKNSYLLEDVAHMAIYESPFKVIKAINQYIG